LIRQLNYSQHDDAHPINKTRQDQEAAAYLADISLQYDPDNLIDEEEQQQEDDHGEEEYLENVENVPPPPKLMG
jgi:hypothetical protein